MSNYPPGVTGNEWQIAGPDQECPVCDGPIWHYGDECEQCPEIREAAIEKIQDAASALDAADFELSKAIWEAANTEPKITLDEITEAATACGDVGSISQRRRDHQAWRDRCAAHEAKKEAEREAKIELFLRQEVAVEDATPSPYKSASTNAKGDGR